jgi:S1-C subfamily serine protease
MRRTMILMVAVLAVLASACSLSYGDRSGSDGEATGLSSTDASAEPIVAGNEPVAAVVDRVLPSVVNVTTDVYQADGSSGQGVGTGFIVREDGVIVTNCHVVEGGSKLTVFLSDEERTEHEARLIGADCENDLAVLDIDEDGLPTVPLGDSDGLRLGQRVVALGYALGLEGGPTVTTGIVSSLDRTIDVPDPNCGSCSTQQTAQGPLPVRTYPSVIQTDAAINPGNSGGPLVDMAGRVVGINSAGNQGAENIAFAIKIDFVRDTVESSIDDPLAPTGYLGVSTTQITPDLRFQQGLDVQSGAFVVGALADGPADDVGIGEGDVIVAVDGHDVRSPDDLGSVLDGLAPGDTVSIDLVESGGQTRTVDVELAARPLPVDIP